MLGDRADIHDYDDATTERLLGIAADVLRSFGSAFGGKHLAIVGGAVPSLLVPEPPRGIERHAGTGDLDLHLSLHLMDGETADYYQAIVDGLRRLGLRPDRQNGRDIKWRWVGRHREIRVQVEFLCPVRQRSGKAEDPAAGTPAEANIGRSGEITALAVGYGHLVLEDTITVERRVETSRGLLSYEFPIAGVASWVCLKTDAMMRRDKPKDAYDIVWLADALGPAGAAQVIKASPLLSGDNAEDVRAQLTRLARDQFHNIESIGPQAYADFLGDGTNPALKRHAMGTITALYDELVAQGVVPGP
ncbi:MAG: hypothetical protein WD271_14800 [Acidimicrobiia bacterium]